MKIKVLKNMRIADKTPDLLQVVLVANQIYENLSDYICDILLQNKYAIIVDDVDNVDNENQVKVINKQVFAVEEDVEEKPKPKKRGRSKNNG